MAPPTVQTLQRLAAETGYRLDTLEKVLRLLELLDEIAQDAVLSQRLALKGGTALNVFYLNLDRLSGGYRLELRRRAGPGGDGARTPGGRCRDRPPVRLAGLRCPPPAYRARRRQVARALRVRTRWQRVAGTRPELHGAPAAVRRSPHGVVYSRPRWDGGAFSFSISTRSWPERSWRCSTGVPRATCSMYGASSRSRGSIGAGSRRDAG